MAVEGSMPLRASYVAGVDLSAQVNQYRAVKLGAANQLVLCVANTDVPIGILQNRPPLGVAGFVVVVGHSKFKAAGITAANDNLSVDAAGNLQTVAPAAAGRFVFGRVIEGTAAINEVGSAYVDFTAPRPA